MAAYNGNHIYLSINGIDVSGEYKKVSFEQSVATVDTTRGAGAEHMMRNTGLYDTKITATIGYDTAKIQQQIAALRPGKMTVILGVEGNAAGKPKHEQVMILTSAPVEVAVEKSEVAFVLSFEGAAAPVVDMMNGGVF